MANADVIYAIAVQGASDAIAAFNAVNEASKKAAASAHLSDLAMTSGAKNVGTFSGRVNELADSFKMVSRDIGTVGGQAAQTFTHIADEALSVVGILTGPSGIAAGIGIAGVAVGALAAAFSVASNTANEYKGIADRALNKAIVDGYKDSVNGVADAFLAARDAAENYSERAEGATVLGLTALLEKKQSELFVATDKVTRTRINAEIDLFTLQLENAKSRLAFISDEREQRDALAESEKEAASREDARKKAKSNKEDAAREFQEGERAFYAVMDARARAYEKDKADKVRANKEAGDILAEAYREIAQDEIDAAKKAADEFEKAAKKKADAAEKAALAFKKMRDELMSVGTAVGVFKNVTAPTFEAGMMVISSAMSVANKYLDEFGTINRDNWRDMLSFSKDKQAAFAAEAQAALWSLARQAAPKAIYENAEGIASAAAAAGEYGKGNVAGGVLLTAAAVGHYAASAAYGTIAVAAGGGSLAIGAARGKGGLVAASPGGGGGGMSGGPGASPRSSGGGFTGGGGSSTPGGGSVNITYVYEAGSINAADERATARTVANGVGAARGSWFERRRMERRV